MCAPCGPGTSPVADTCLRDPDSDGAITHAVRNPVRLAAGEGRNLVVGADRAGRRVEVVVLDDDPDEEPVIIQAMAFAPEVPQLPEVNPMPRTRARLEQAVADTDAWLKHSTPKPSRRRTPMAPTCVPSRRRCTPLRPSTLHWPTRLPKLVRTVELGLESPRRQQAGRQPANDSANPLTTDDRRCLPGSAVARNGIPPDGRYGHLHRKPRGSPVLRMFGERRLLARQALSSAGFDIGRWTWHDVWCPCESFGMFEFTLDTAHARSRPGFSHATVGTSTAGPASAGVAGTARAAIGVKTITSRARLIVLYPP